jgi:hypothetical protein
MQGSIYPMIHWNSAATDVTGARAWVGDHEVQSDQVTWQPMPPSNVGAAHYPYPDGEEAFFVSGSNSVSKMRSTDGALELIDRIIIPGYDEQNATEDEIRGVVEAIDSGGTDETRYLPPLQAYTAKHRVDGQNLAFGVYTLLDRDGNYFSGWGTTVYKVADEEPGNVRSNLKVVESFDVKDGLPSDQAGKISRLLGLGMTYDGYVVVAMPGIIAVLDRDLSNMKHIMLEGEAIDNGITVDDGGGIYVVTSKYMRKLVWNGGRLSDGESDGAWKSEYDYVHGNPHAFSRGAGNTPTPMGFGPDEQHLVIIADAGEPVKFVALWRDEIPEDFEQVPGTKSRRIAGQLELSFNPPATIEWSPHVYGFGAMMFASSWPDPVKSDDKLDLYSTVLSAGVSRAAPRGSEKISWDPDTYTLTSNWTTDYGMQWALHPISSATNTVHLAELKDGVYSLVAIDWTTGKEIGRTKLGTSAIFNTMGGFFIPLENGDIYVTGVFGPVRIASGRHN